MAELEIAGAKIKGGKILLVLPVLSALGGGLWGGFEFYKDYMDMKEKIQTYEAPDLSDIHEKLAVLKEEMMATKEISENFVDTVRDAKSDTRADIVRVEKVVDRVENDIDEVEDELRTTVEESEAIAQKNKEYVREFINDTDKRYDDKISGLEGYVKRELENLEDRLNDKLTKALDNPLANR